MLSLVCFSTELEEQRAILVTYIYICANRNTVKPRVERVRFAIESSASVTSLVEYSLSADRITFARVSGGEGVEGSSVA